MPILSGPLLDAICAPQIPVIPLSEEEDDDDIIDEEEDDNAAVSSTASPATSPPISPSQTSTTITISVPEVVLSSSTSSPSSLSSSSSSATSTSLTSTPTPTVSSSTSLSASTASSSNTMVVDELSDDIAAIDIGSRRRSAAVAVPLPTSSTATPPISPTLAAAAPFLPSGFLPFTLAPAATLASGTLSSSSNVSSASSTLLTQPATPSSAPSPSASSLSLVSPAASAASATTSLSPSSSSSSPAASPSSSSPSNSSDSNGSSSNSNVTNQNGVVMHSRQLRPSRSPFAGGSTASSSASSSNATTPSSTESSPNGTSSTTPNNNAFLPFAPSAVSDAGSSSPSPSPVQAPTPIKMTSRKSDRSISAPSIPSANSRHRRALRGTLQHILPSPLSSADQSTQWWLPSLQLWQRSLMNEVDGWVNIVNTAHNSRARMRVLARGGDRGRDRDLGADATTGMKFPSPSPSAVNKNGHTTLKVVTCDFVIDEVRSRSHTIESNVDSQHALFLANNPSLFEWTNGDLTEQSNRLPKAIVTKREQLIALVDTASRAELIAAGVDLEADIHMTKPYVLPTLDESKLVLLACSGVLRETMSDANLFFLFIRAWLSHVLDTSRGAVVWSSVPAYLPVVQAFLRRMVVCLSVLSRHHIESTLSELIHYVWGMIA
jgi:hypothetical protein